VLQEKESGATGRSLGSVFGEAEFLQSLREIRISGIGGYLYNGINVVRGTRLSRCLVCVMSKVVVEPQRRQVH
jgi:hypothetical protein